MFLAIRELRFARGRFGLMGAVVGLIAVLMVMLSGLASGLVNDGVSGLKSLPVTAFRSMRGRGRTMRSPVRSSMPSRSMLGRPSPASGTEIRSALA